MTAVFLSYAHIDKPRVRVIGLTLAALGHDIFWDEDLPAGEDWRAELDRQLARTQCVLVAWSRSSVGSTAVALEAWEGLRMNCLLPVLLEDARPPESFAHLQAVDLRAWIGNVRDVEWSRVTKCVEQYAARPTRAAGVDRGPFGDRRDGTAAASSQLVPRRTISKHQALLEQQIRTALTLAPVQLDAFADLTTIRTYDEAEFRQQLSALEGHGYCIVEQKPGEALLERYKKFNWPVAVLLGLAFVFPLLVYLLGYALMPARSRLYVVQVSN